jgi:hypothetical protein
MGTSGTGKGTRLENFINFLTATYGDPTILRSINPKNGKVLIYGIEFPTLDLVVIGRLATSNKTGVVGWSSLDMMNSSTGATDATIDFIKKHCQDKHVIAEGEPMIQSNKYRPNFMKEHYPCERTFHMIFYYPTREVYIDRIIGRSGKAPKGDAGWGRNDSYVNYIDKVTSENFTDMDYASKHHYDAPVDLFGSEYLKFLGRHDLVEDFVKYVSENRYLKSETKQSVSIF